MSTDNALSLHIAQRLGDLFGLHFSENQWGTMWLNLQEVARELGRETVSTQAWDWLLDASVSSFDQDVLARHFTVGETYFFREKVALDFFLHLLFRNGMHNNGLRIWCAGCSSGEEPYTLAILLRENLAQLASLPITIIGTDINPEALIKAEAGLYSAWSFRETSPEVKRKYFQPRGRFFQIDPVIRQMVRFEKYNLAFPGPVVPNWLNLPFDFIFCRNVLMYFRPEVAKKVSSLFFQNLLDGGWLIPGQVELNDDYFPHFQKDAFNKGFFYQKLREKKYPISAPVLPMDDGLPKKNRSRISSRVSSQIVHHPVAESNSPVRAVESERPTGSARADLFNLLSGLFAEGRYEECAKQCRSELDLDPLQKDILGLLAKCLANRGKLEEAALLAEKLIDMDPIDAGHYYLYGTILMELAEWEQAEVVLRKCLFLHPDLSAAQFAMGTVLRQMGQSLLANRHFAQLLKRLQSLPNDDAVWGMDGITVGQLRESVPILSTQ
jgi:chemotaxis protein methyltransferase CheR